MSRGPRGAGGLGIRSRVVSMPSWELFERQEPGYRHEVLPPSITARVAVEQASTLGWARYTGLDGAVIGMETFGASAPMEALQTRFGFTPGRLVSEALEQVRRQEGRPAGSISSSQSNRST